MSVLAIAACGRTDASAGSPDAGGADTSSPVDLRCSGDLRDVTDSAGNVVLTCPPDQGCANGVCVGACDAAAASKGSVGCDFVVATPSMSPSIKPPCFAVFVANNWPSDAELTIERDGVSYSATTFGRVPDGSADAAAWPAVPASGLASESVAVLFLSSDPDANNAGPQTCPITPAVNAPNGTAVFTYVSGGERMQTGIGEAWHITSSVPISAYDIHPYGGASTFVPSAELILPTTAWGDTYVAASPVASLGPGWGQVVASVDGTTIEVSPTVALPPGPGVVAAPVGQTTTYHLDAGQYIQWQDAGDIAGSLLTADKPISFTGGNGYVCLLTATASDGGCDAVHQMIPPLAALGSEYVASPHATRRLDLQPESIKYRLVGAVDGVQLTYEPAIGGAPATLAAGQAVELETTLPFVVRSQDDMHPFYVAQYMSGCRVVSGSRPATSAGDGCVGDEEFVNVLPPAQWLNSYVFFTDPTFATTNLVVTRKATGSVFQDVTIECLGTVTGWQTIGAGQYEVAYVDLRRGADVGACRPGRQAARSAGPFGITVWGLDQASSYAYPAGGNVARINPVTVIL